MFVLQLLLSLRVLALHRLLLRQMLARFGLLLADAIALELLDLLIVLALHRFNLRSMTAFVFFQLARVGLHRASC